MYEVFVEVDVALPSSVCDECRVKNDVSENVNTVWIEQFIWNYIPCCFGFVIVVSKLLKRHSKSKRRAHDYSPALWQIRGDVQSIVHGRFRSGCQRVRGARRWYKM